jgi:hypothetical protein
LNRNTPLISAGLVGAADGAKLYNNKREDMVSLSATIAFLRANGLDSLVDAYGIHTYPSSGQPGNPVAAANRAARFTSVDIAECRAAGNSGGKPCWITEWGFPNAEFSCPTSDAARTLLVREMRGDFARAAAQGRLMGITYFAWIGYPHHSSATGGRAGPILRTTRLASAGAGCIRGTQHRCGTTRQPLETSWGNQRQGKDPRHFPSCKPITQANWSEGDTLFAWNSDPWAKQPDADSVYRCGALTPSGRLAIAPLAGQ